MDALKRIRTTIFRETQSRFGEIAGVSQSTVSKWETGELQPDRAQLALIRAEAARRELMWDDSWFFEASSLVTRGQTRVAA